MVESDESRCKYGCTVHITAGLLYGWWKKYVRRRWGTRGVPLVEAQKGFADVYVFVVPEAIVAFGGKSVLLVGGRRTTGVCVEGATVSKAVAGKVERR